MKWMIPEINNKRREDIGPCVVTIEKGEDVIEIGVKIIEAAIKEGASYGLSTISALFNEMFNETVISEEDKLYFKEKFETKKNISMDYWNGIAVKLSMWIVDSNTIRISINYWMDRFPGAPINVPQEVIDELQNVLEIANGQKLTSQDRIKKGTSEDNPLQKLILGFLNDLGILDDEENRKKEIKEERNRKNKERSKLGQKIRDAYAKRVVEMIVKKHQCPKEYIKLKMSAFGWMPEIMEMEHWNARIEASIGSKKLGFKLNSKLEIIEGSL